MITRVTVGTLFRGEIDAAVFENLAQIYPAGVRGSHRHAFWAQLDAHDLRLDRIVEVLKKADLRPWTDISREMNRGCEFGMRYERVYEAGDLNALPALELVPPSEAHFFDSPRRDDGLIRLLKDHLNDSTDFGATDISTWYVVPDRVKRILEQSGMLGVVFRPTLLLPGTYADASVQPVPWDTHGEPWWELDSDLTMPALSDSMTFHDSDGRPLKDREFSNGFIPEEGLYMHPELHYRESDVAKLAPWDLARTLEPFGNVRGYDRTMCPLVASKRFYKFCVQHNLKTGWVPVRIDPG